MQRACAKHGGQFSHLVGAPGGDALAKAVALVEAGEMTPVIDRTFAFDQAAEAIAYHRLGRVRSRRAAPTRDAARARAASQSPVEALCRDCAANRRAQATGKVVVVISGEGL